MPRHAAFLCLRQRPSKPLDAVDAVARERGLDERDTGLVRKLVGTEVRRRATLRAIVAGFAHQKPKAELALLLRLGVLQLVYLDRVPDHAAVSETVRAASDFLGLSKGKVVNGVMRNVARALREGKAGDPTLDLEGTDKHFDGPVFRDPNEHPHLWAEDALSIPSALHKKWTQRVGLEEATRLARVAFDEAPLSLRVRASDGAQRDASIAAFEEAGIPARAGQHARVLLVPSEHAGAALRSEAFTSGTLTAQGEHALRAAELAGDVRGRRVLDVCAAPGGKSVVFAEQEPSALVSIDLSARRLGRAPRNFERLGLETPQLAAMDGTGALAPDATFDAVFLDAPCSNTGVLAQRPGARWRYGPKSQAALVELQAALALDASQRVAPGGVFVYSTCSLEPEENEQRVARLLELSTELTLEEEVRSAPRSYADGGPTDGGYAARLRRKAQ